jgi:predicted tellurium resistance membrane protein TerC
MEFFALEGIGDPATWVQLVTLAGLEIVLGVDNLVFIAILTERLPPEKRSFGRRLGLALALVTRLILLATIAWIVSLTPALHIFGFGLSWRDIILLGAGLPRRRRPRRDRRRPRNNEGGGHCHRGRDRHPDRSSTSSFPLDSVITAVGMADHPG